MNDLIYKVSLDMNDRSSQALVKLRQYNTGAKIIFTLTQNGKPYVLKGVNALLCSDRVEQLREGETSTQFLSYVSQCVVNINDNTIEFSCDDEVLVQYANLYSFQLVILEDTMNPKVISSPKFDLQIDETFSYDGEIPIVVVNANHNYVNLSEAIVEINNLDIAAGRDDGGNLTIQLTGRDGKTETHVLLGDNGVTSSKIAGGAVTTPKIADAAVTRDKIVDNAINTSKLNNNAVTSEKINGRAVTSEKIQKEAIINELLAKPSVRTENLYPFAVKNEKIANGAITTPKIADAAVTEEKIADKAVTLSKLSDDLQTKLDIENVTNVSIDNQINFISYSHTNHSGCTINTEEEYVYNCKHGYTSIKGDIRLTSDNKLIMCHDAGFTFNDNGDITTYDATNESTQVIYDYDYDYWIAKQYEDGSFVCDFETYIRTCKKYGKTAFITIRYEYLDQTISELLYVLDKYRMKDNCIVNCTSWTPLNSLREKDNEILMCFTTTTAEAVGKSGNPAMRTHINSAAEWGNCIVCGWDFPEDATTPDDRPKRNGTTALEYMFDDGEGNSVTVVEYARSKDVRFYEAVIYSEEDALNCIDKGVLGLMIACDVPIESNVSNTSEKDLILYLWNGFYKYFKESISVNGQTSPSRYENLKNASFADGLIEQHAQMFFDLFDALETKIAEQIDDCTFADIYNEMLTLNEWYDTTFCENRLYETSYTDTITKLLIDVMILQADVANIKEDLSGIDTILTEILGDEVTTNE